MDARRTKHRDVARRARRRRRDRGAPRDGARADPSRWDDLAAVRREGRRVDCRAVMSSAAPPYSTARVQVVRGSGAAEEDLVAVEEPLEIRIAGGAVAVTMRTPG